MRRPLALLALCAPLVGCGGSDVTLTPTKIRAERDALTCNVDPAVSSDAPDACDRSLDGVTSNVPHLRQVLAAVTVLDTAARQADADLWSACEAARTWAGDSEAQYDEHGYGTDGTGTTTAHACALAADALRKELAGATVRVMRTGCHPASLPACLDAEAPNECAVSIEVIVPSGSRDVYVEKALTPLFEATALLDTIPAVVPSLAESQVDVTAACSAEIVKQTTASVGTVSSLTTIAAELTSVLTLE